MEDISSDILKPAESKPEETLLEHKRSRAMYSNYSKLYGDKTNPDFLGFLHRHPKKEERHNVVGGHVIVDKPDWLTVRENYAKYQRAYELCKEIVNRYEHGQVYECDARLDYAKARKIVEGTY